MRFNKGTSTALNNLQLRFYAKAKDRLYFELIDTDQLNSTHTKFLQQIQIGKDML